MTDFDLDGNITLDVDGRAKVFGILKSAKANRLRKRHRGRGGLLRFVKDFWHVLEPENPFVDGWPIAAICEHLEAVSDGRITRLLINVPPGFSKSLITDVFWPAYEWATGKAHLRYVTFSYSSSLTERDNRRFGALVSSPEFQEVYGAEVILRKLGDKMVSNTRTGWKLASSVGGVSTGERGDRIVCFPYHQVVATEIGPVAIGALVENRSAVRVWSYNRASRQFELKPISGWHRNPGRPLVKIVTSDGRSLTCTFEHPVLAVGGYRLACSLRVGDTLLAAPRWVSLSSPSVVGSQVEIEVSPSAPAADAADGVGADAVALGKRLRGFIVTGRNLAHHCFRQVVRSIVEPAVAFAVSNVLRSRAVLQIAQAGVSPVVVSVTHLLSGGARAKKRRRDHLMNEAVNCAAVHAQCDARVALVQGRGHETAGYSQGPSFSHHDARNASDAPQVRNFVGAAFDDVAPDLVTVSSVQVIDHVPSNTYCLTVADNHNMLCGELGSNIICSNCDDPHNVKEAESEIIRTETVRWFREAMSNRLNNMKTGAIVIIMQRVHEDDVSGAILANQLDYEHLMVPMEYDVTRQVDNDGEPIRTSIGWYDPRYDMGDTLDDVDGLLAWPERFDEEVTARMKHDMGPYGFSGQYQQAPAPRGGGIFKRDWWQLWEGKDGKFPTFEYLIGSLDGAFTDKEQNDPSALTIWGIFQSDEGKRRIMLVHAWRKHLQFSGPRIEMEIGESKAAWVKRTQDTWGLVEWLRHTCERFHVDLLLVEAKASGISAAQELRSRYDDLDFAIQLCPVKGDKLARALACQATFSQQLVYAPDREWAEMVIDEMAVFPKGKHDDLTDSTTQAIKYLRDNGLAQTDLEANREEMERVTHDGRRQKRRRSIYGV